MKLLNVFIVFVLFISEMFAQQSGIYRNLTDMKFINSAFKIESGIWAATSGGVFYFDHKDNSYKKLTKADGLNGSVFTAITKDNDGKIWIGGQNGSIDVYNPIANSVNKIWDIYQSGKNFKQINDLKCYGDSIFISMDFGLSIINSKTLNFIDTYTKFGTFSSNIKIKYSIKYKNQIYVATESGLAVQKAGSYNLSAPESWDTYPLSDISKIEIFNDTLLAAHKFGFKRFYQNSLNNFLDTFNYPSKYDFLVQNDSLIIGNGNGIFIYKNNNLKNTTLSSFYNFVSLLYLRKAI